MKKIYTIFSILSFVVGIAQNGAPASPYYNGFNWSQTGMTLKTSLANKISITHTRTLTYSQAESALRYTDLDPTDATNSNVLLVYGYSNNLCTYVDESDFGTSADGTYHRRRNKNADVSGPSMCAWNREHIFAQALGNPDLGQVGPGADAQMLRTCDVQFNSDRGNKLYTAGTGNAGSVGSYWYPGDEWKGDAARIIMYMYLRYGSQCLPTFVATGSTVGTDSNMPNLLLQWNAEDPVSAYEDQRNTYLGTTSNTYGQGNRNPFIDNPYLATVIWGGPVAQNRWPSIFLSTESFDALANVSVYPNPSNDHRINISSEVELDEIQLININGQVVQYIKSPNRVQEVYTIENLPQGFYFVKLSTADNQSTTKKILVN